MSEIKLISPILDGFIVGDPIRDRNGVRSCPAIKESTEEKCIVKVISVPPSSTQLDALLLSGAYETKEDALKYYESLSADIVKEVETLNKLSELEGFMPFTDCQLVPMDDGNGFDVYLLNSYKLSLARKFNKETMTHLGALNLGLDLCAALSVCRRLGYIYVDLKPENIYITTDNGYRIGDIGFLNLDSLRYASLPDRYRSAYTAPELLDPLSPLNTTIDVYAVGLILHQAFNGGILPTMQDDSPLPPPDYADYEMSEIILKACAMDPADRWEDPVQLGNALVGYMQRNGAHDTPIVPPAAPIQEVPSAEEDTAETANDVNDPLSDTVEVTTLTDEDETLPGADIEDLDYEQVSEEVSEILTQADDLIAHDTPDPVQPPEPIDVQLPIDDCAENEQVPDSDDVVSVDHTVEAKEPESDSEDSSVEPQDSQKDTIDSSASEEFEASDEAVSGDVEDNEKQPKRRWIAITAIVALIIILLTAGILYYKHIYIQHINELSLEGNGTHLTVYVKTDFDESKLIVVCSDTYDQNQREAALVDGVAQFNDLPLGSPFTITVKAKGFHALKGETTKTYATPKATQVNDFVALTGPEDGSVNLSFSVSGPDSAEWTITYSAQDEEPTTVTCVEHTASIPTLTIGKEYTFELRAGDDVQLIDRAYIIKHTPSISFVSKDLHIDSYEDGKISVSWTSSNNESTTQWNVRCYSKTESEYNQSVVTQETHATFEGLLESNTYTIEIRADGMSQVSVFTVPANPIRIQAFTAATQNGVTVLSWNCTNENVDEGWFIHCTNQESFAYNEPIRANAVSLNMLVPDTEYHFVLNHEDPDVSDSLVGNCLSYQMPAAESFANYGVTAKDIRFELCLTPSSDNGESEYVPTNTFAIGEKAYMGVNLGSSVKRPNQDVLIQYVIKNQAGKIVGAAAETANWGELWTWRGTGKLYLPFMPEVPGEYSVAIYFDGSLAMTDVFSVTES